MTFADVGNASHNAEVSPLYSSKGPAFKRAERLSKHFPDSKFIVTELPTLRKWVVVKKVL